MTGNKIGEKFKIELHRSFKCKLNKLQNFRTRKTRSGAQTCREMRASIQAVFKFPKDCHASKKITWKRRFLLNINRNFLTRRWMPWLTKLLSMNLERSFMASVWVIADFFCKGQRVKHSWLCRPYDPCINSASAARKQPEIMLTNRHWLWANKTLRTKAGVKPDGCSLPTCSLY